MSKANYISERKTEPRFIKEPPYNCSALFPSKRPGNQPKMSFEREQKAQGKPSFLRMDPSEMSNFRSPWTATVILKMCFPQINLAERWKAYGHGFL